MQRQPVRDVINAAVIADTAATHTAQMLKLWRRLTPDTWAEQLDKRAAGLLVGSYMRDSRWPEVLEVFQQRKSDAQVGACMHQMMHALMAMHSCIVWPKGVWGVCLLEAVTQHTFTLTNPGQ